MALNRRLLVAAALFAAASSTDEVAGATDPASLEAALDVDGECSAGEDCTLNAIQLRGLKETPQGDETDIANGYGLGPPLYADADPKWDETGDEDDQGDDWDGDGTMKAMSASSYSYCSSNPGASRCGLYAACHGRSYCVFGNYMVVPGAPIAGMESINSGSAGSLNYLMNVARSHCGISTCVLMTNPVHHRTQDQLHIHYRYYNGGGAAMKSRLERAVCHKEGWTHFNTGCCGCGRDSKARAYSGFPGVFSEVAAAYGGGSLASVGISVWFTGACGGGMKTIILATTHCSIEHSVSAR